MISPGNQKIVKKGESQGTCLKQAALPAAGTAADYNYGKIKSSEFESIYLIKLPHSVLRPTS